MKEIVDYWEKFYQKDREIGNEPSRFAWFIADRFPKHRFLVDVGCGSGRDSLFFAERGWTILGVDASENAIDNCRKLHSDFGEQCEFLTVDIGRGEVGALIATRSYPLSQTLIYARFFLHAITDHEEEIFLRSVAGLVAAGAMLCIEARSVDDADLLKIQPAHYRRFIKPRNLEARCRALKMRAEFVCSSQGFAPYGLEDPIIVRGIFSGTCRGDD